MTVDKYRIAKMVQNARRVEVLTLNPHESDRTRQDDVRKLITETTRQSNTRTMLLIAVEI